MALGNARFKLPGLVLLFVGVWAVPLPELLSQEWRSIPEAVRPDSRAVDSSSGGEPIVLDISDFDSSNDDLVNNADKAAGANRSEADNRVVLGYDDGFLLATSDSDSLSSRDFPFQLKLNGWGQLRHAIFESSNGGSDLNQFQLKRARIVASGSAFTPDFRYYIQLDGRSSSGDQLRLLDYYLSYDVGHSVLGWEAGRLGIRSGKYKMPFSMARWLSGKEFEFSDRSVGSTFFDVNRSLATGFYGRSTRLAIPVDWEIAVFNGLVTGGAETGSSGALDNNFAYSTRIFAYPIGNWGSGQLADFDCHATPAVRIGGGFANTVVERVGSTEFEAFRVADSGAKLVDILPASVNKFEVSLFAVDASLKYRGWSTTVEVYFRNISNFEGGAVPDLFDHGYWFQLSKFVVPEKLQVISRWSRVVGTSGSLGGQDQSSDEISGGMAWYFRRQNAKLTLDVTRLNGAPVSSSALDISPGAEGYLVRSQLQFSF